MATPVIVTERNFDEIVLQSSVPVIVDFWAVWCGPCRAVAPILDELASEHDGKLLVTKVNVDEEPGLAARFKITSIPTMKIFNAGREEKELVGAMPKNAIEMKLAEYIAN
jgi:thioredoxin 1